MLLEGAILKLISAEILNYRSIKSQTVLFQNQCQVLVGINESGKSNVLNALSTLSPKYKTTTGDERQNLPDEPETPEQSRIRFLFNLSKEDYDAILGRIVNRAYLKTSTKVLNNGATDVALTQFLKIFEQVLYDVDIRASTKSAKYYSFDEDAYTLNSELYKPTPECPEEFTFTNIDGNTVTPAVFKLLKLTETEKQQITEGYVEPASKKDLFNLVTGELLTYERDSLPEVVYWEFTDKDLLPTHVSLSRFTANPDEFKPLKNMFKLAGIDDIPEAIKREKAKGATQLNNLLKRVSISASDYLQRVWKEYKEVKFSLQMDGTNIRCTITEENEFPFGNRSDGFKKFLAFLLGVSSTSHTGTLSNALILIDEPETGLHPSGARYLRDELLKVSKSNYVVYSTHSIFMIDRHEIGRHLIVSKKRETTTLTSATVGNVVDEEVIFNAINYSTFEHLSEQNVLLEGWRDRRLLEVFTKSYEKAFFTKIGIIHGKGVPSFRALIPTLELAERKAVIVSDNDRAAKDSQKQFNDLGYQTEWLTYSEISSTTTAVTGEDFIKNEVLVDKFKVVTLAAGNEIVLQPNDLPDDDKLSFLKGKLLQSSYDDVQAKAAIEELKKAVFNNLTKTQIEDRYKQLIDDIKTYVEEKFQ